MNVNEKVVNMKDFKKEAFKRKLRDYADDAKKKGLEALEWAKEHPAETVAIVTGLAAAGGKASKYLNTKAEDRRRAVDFYDNRLGTHAIARRPLTTKEALEVERRYTQNKESYKHILYDMRLLK